MTAGSIAALVRMSVGQGEWCADPPKKSREQEQPEVLGRLESCRARAHILVPLVMPEASKSSAEYNDWNLGQTESWVRWVQRKQAESDEVVSHAGRRTW